MSLAALDGFFDRAAKKLAATDRPYVTLKAASTLDGRIATSGGESRWITGEESRRAGHLLRRIHSAILVGIRTVEADDPQLTIRLDSWENSLSGLPSSLARVVLDSSCRIAPGSRVLAEDGCRRVVIAGSDAPPEKVEGLRRRGVEVWLCPTPKPEPGFFLPRLRGEGLSSLLVEGGGKVHAGLIAQQEADEVFLFISGWVFGQGGAPGWVGDLGVKTLAQAPRFFLSPPEMLGGDVLMHGVKPPVRAKPRATQTP